MTSLRKCLKSNPELCAEYNHIFKQYEEAKIVERVTEESGTEVDKVHYLPHRPVVRHDKQITKVCAVFDASAKHGRLSLNECLYAGPNLLPKIFNVLRFRTNKITLLCDIKQTFLNICIHDGHKDFLRFLWYENIDNNYETIVYRFLRIVFGVASSPFLLNETIRHHCSRNEEDIEFIIKFLESLYVDDSLSGSEYGCLYVAKFNDILYVQQYIRYVQRYIICIQRYIIYV